MRVAQLLNFCELLVFRLKRFCGKGCSILLGPCKLQVRISVIMENGFVKGDTSENFA